MKKIKHLAIFLLMITFITLLSTKAKAAEVEEDKQYTLSQTIRTFVISESFTHLSINAYLSCPSFNSHLSRTTSTPCDTNRSASSITSTSLVQEYEINIFGCLSSCKLYILLFSTPNLKQLIHCTLAVVANPQNLFFYNKGKL